MSGILSSLRDFGTRSLLIHAIMSVTLPVGFLIGLTVDSQLGLVSFVALLNFTAGMWICQSIHSLGSEANEDGYDGVINEIRAYVK
ncbi:hypothetical protein DJ82_10200 [Halorubrum sp. Ib24]|uniref:hypothetical protein n=1 Tax=unclassified Halorubrum TaxID=2642239 RepID=UPI000B9873DE|nr:MULTISPECIES: hypothetical protein [unclassified Halorubrum]OYR38815.1 hypothetical protein DJ82_10200 [Halorubrum sp. Ib24]OYR43746.1 hypothetical protein DJ75_11135 [Halorubrum sp. Eb13]OYR44966.1 hypothetical protein DJ81_06120 [Halorubrum sp. Hd13]OYR50354.1 hypothetical protein DJ73_16120 [Halorubrum sp. Ea1]OYR50764.1 hypothetical protein DJ74_05420 [Halorubrum sp. Ea8]